MKFLQKCNKMGRKAQLAAVAALATVGSTSAFATSTVGEILSTEISSAKPEILLVLTAMAGLLVLLVIWAFMRRATGK
jgi:hypothetical protein